MLFSNVNLLIQLANCTLSPLEMGVHTISPLALGTDDIKDLEKQLPTLVHCWNYHQVFKCEGCNNQNRICSNFGSRKTLPLEQKIPDWSSGIFLHEIRNLEQCNKEGLLLVKKKKILQPTLQFRLWMGCDSIIEPCAHLPFEPLTCFGSRCMPQPCHKEMNDERLCMQQTVSKHHWMPTASTAVKCLLHHSYSFHESA